MAEREVRFEPFVRKERSDADAAAKRRRPAGASRRRVTRSEATQDAAVKRRRPEGVSAANQSRPSARTQAKESLKPFLWRRERIDSNPSFERNAVTPTPQRSVGAPQGRAEGESIPTFSTHPSQGDPQPLFLWRRERLDSNPSFERNAVTPTPQRSVGAPKANQSRSISPLPSQGDPQSLCLWRRSAKKKNSVANKRQSPQIHANFPIKYHT